jgi:hypothetical protein
MWNELAISSSFSKNILCSSFGFFIAGNLMKNTRIIGRISEFSHKTGFSMRNVLWNTKQTCWNINIICQSLPHHIFIHTITWKFNLNDPNRVYWIQLEKFSENIERNLRKFFPRRGKHTGMCVSSRTSDDKVALTGIKTFFSNSLVILLT